jgi:hypothetical protein
MRKHSASTSRTIVVTLCLLTVLSWRLFDGIVSLPGKAQFGGEPGADKDPLFVRHCRDHCHVTEDANPFGLLVLQLKSSRL